MAFAFSNPLTLAELRRRKEFANACVPPWRPDLRPEPAETAGSWSAFAHVLRDLFRASRGPAHRGLKPETTGR